jgi:hypothetical protein
MANGIKPTGKIGTNAWIMGMVGLFISVWVIAKGWEAGSK